MRGAIDPNPNPKTKVPYLHHLPLEEVVLAGLDAGIRRALEAHEPYHARRWLLHADHFFDHLFFVTEEEATSQKGQLKKKKMQIERIEEVRIKERKEIDAIRIKHDTQQTQ